MSGRDRPTDKVTLVTGAGSGMGMETALHLASRGYRVYGSVCTEAEQIALEAATRARNVSIEILRFDVMRDDQVRPAIDSMMANSRRIDALVQFVGIGLRGFFEDLDIS
ncbi:MAG TPA: SDR family NAD(P)-dependent oxidoreductase, partial [Bryobacteraceae bacterium]|nr:SDR family NAD(P)-dependent oxidoreductase [Bryobacteraceae bacterium]